MAYTPTEWECGESITSERLNKLEEGVADIMSEYVPTEWQCGDVITAERLNKLEQAVAEASEGGGGSSDFSTATVTFDNQAGAQIMLPHIMSIPDDERSAPSLDNGMVQAILYKGKAMGVILGGTVTVTGSATYSAPALVVTGDCTITIS